MVIDKCVVVAGSFDQTALAQLPPRTEHGARVGRSSARRTYAEANIFALSGQTRRLGNSFEREATERCAATAVAKQSVAAITSTNADRWPASGVIHSVALATLKRPPTYLRKCATRPGPRDDRDAARIELVEIESERLSAAVRSRPSEASGSLPGTTRTRELPSFEERELEAGGLSRGLSRLRGSGHRFCGQPLELVAYQVAPWTMSPAACSTLRASVLTTRS